MWGSDLSDPLKKLASFAHKVKLQEVISENYNQITSLSPSKWSDQKKDS